MNLLLEMLFRALGPDLVEPHGAVSGEPGVCYGKYDNNSITIITETDYSSIDMQGSILKNCTGWANAAVMRTTVLDKYLTVVSPVVQMIIVCCSDPPTLCGVAGRKSSRPRRSLHASLSGVPIPHSGSVAHFKIEKAEHKQHKAYMKSIPKCARYCHILHIAVLDERPENRAWLKKKKQMTPAITTSRKAPPLETLKND